jgi:hypothetical protein
MPPPRPSTEYWRTEHLSRLAAQIVRALRGRGPMTSPELQAAVGAEFWVPGEYDKALALARGDGMIVRGPQDRYTAA